MNLFQFVATIVHDLLIFVGVMSVLLVVLAITIARLPSDNPLKRILYALSLRLGATLGAAAVAIPLEPIPGIDVAYDVAAPLALIYFWVRFFREAAAILKTAKRIPGPRDTNPPRLGA
jgi:hypothetical protein